MGGSYNPIQDDNYSGKAARSADAWEEERKTETGDRGKKRKYALNQHLCASLVGGSPSCTLHKGTTFKV